MFVIGTAGHVDHGKSTLVHALTGIDPDRLQEEKARGMTIDLGFAWLTLPSGREVSVVDVPGHERFIKNMLAGVGGIDLAMLVVAADEGVMPQTREHLDILSLLEVSHGVAVITKADLVDEEWLELVTADVQAALQSTPLRAVPVMPVSAVTGAGLPELKARLDQLLDAAPRPTDVGRPRLPIDRVFTVSGFGTVVTGTLIGGGLRVGDEVEVQPGTLRTRIRGIQSHRTRSDAAQPGSRIAVNLTNVAVEDLRRGMVLARPGAVPPSRAFDVALQVVTHDDVELRHNAPITFHTAAAEAAGKIRLLEGSLLAGGQRSYAQVVLDEPVAALRGDRFVIRSNGMTIGGGEIVETQARRHKRGDIRLLEHLATLQAGTPEERLIQELEQRQPVARATLLKASTVEGASDALGTLLTAGDAVLLGDDQVVTRSWLAQTSSQVQDLLQDWHRRYPLREGMPREELRTRLKLTGRTADSVLARVVADGQVEERHGVLASSGFRPTLSAGETALVAQFLDELRKQPFSPEPSSTPDAEVLAFLERSGQVVLAGDVTFARSAWEEMVERVKRHAQQNGQITVAEVRDLFGNSRKYALALMEELDARKITRRVGDARVLRLTNQDAG